MEYKIIWEPDPVTKLLTWQKAVEYCDNLEKDGYNDWRLPIIQELFSIIDFTKKSGLHVK